MLCKINIVIFWLLTTLMHAHTLSVCAIFNNEADYLKEWIDYHRAVGVEYFYLYNNNSTDHFEEVLEPYIQKGLVALYDWPSPPDADWVPAQIHAYNHCREQVKGITQWLAIIDIDEFIVPISHENIPSLLKEYNSYDGLKIFWQTFGTSHLPELPEDKKMIESLFLKYPQDHPRNKTGKCIIQPEKVKKCHIHDHEYQEGSTHACISLDKVRINHYWTRAEDYFYNQKIPRMERHDGKAISQEKIDQILFESNLVEDTSIWKFLEIISSL